MSLDFNGTSSLVGWPVSALLRAGGDTTMCAWIRLDTLKVCGIINDNKGAATHRGLWMSMADTSGNLDISYGDNTGSASSDRRTKTQSAGTTVATGAWYHVACWLVGPTNMAIFVNGTDVGGAYTGTGGSVAYNTGVGGFSGSLAGGSFLDGRMAEIGYWDVVLSNAEIAALARGVSPRLTRPGSLVAHWPYWDATNPTIDLSANSLEASTLTNVSAANHAPVGCPYPLI